ncbi:InlB B-repeat-containing protein, partial [Turicimonas muris]|uniref:InlB B-repeat-containing protein n=1 Tax=Turicimonas muris TaxID=1796652 RepID=UPI0025B706B2
MTYSATDGGYIDGQAEQQLESGKDGLTVVAVPYDGYEFVKWSDGRTEATRQDINITADISVTAEFKVKIEEQTKEYTVTYKANEGGTINGNVNQTVKEGENGTEVTAVPDDGYEFVKWSDGVTEATRQDRNVIQDIVVKAIFEKQTYKLTYVASNGGYLVGNANQTVTYGESGTKVTAVPNDGYRFVKWSDG